MSAIMRSKSQESPNRALFQQDLNELLNERHELVLLSKKINWSVFEEKWSVYFPSTRGRPALPPRLVAGLLYLQHMFDYSDEALIRAWVENPYWQYFCGETYFQHTLPCDPSSLTVWRKRIGEEGVEWMLSVTVQAGLETNTINETSFDKVIADTTVQEKAISHPTDSRLLNRCRKQLVVFAEKAGLSLRQNYNRIGPQWCRKIGGYAHAKQYKRMKSLLKKLKTLTGRVYRDVSRQAEQIPSHLQNKGKELLEKAARLLSQEKNSKNKLYALHAPEVECISKGKTHKRYEFGVKASLVVTHHEGFAVGARSMPGNPYDGHTLAEAIEQMEIITQHSPKQIFTDLGYRGHELKREGMQVYHSRLKRSMSRKLKADIRRRSAIEPMIGHMKNDGKLRRNWLKGTQGDALNVVLCACGHNLRLILRKLRQWLAHLLLFLSRFISILIRLIFQTLEHWLKNRIVQA
jgi:transposase, IS5 family